MDLPHTIKCTIVKMVSESSSCINVVRFFFPMAFTDGMLASPFLLESFRA